MGDAIEPGGGDTATPINLRRRVALIERSGALARLRVLDAGCGSGGYVDAMEARGADVTGVEFDPACVSAWRERHPGEDRVGVGDLARLPHADATFDLVLMNEVLEHVPDDRAGLREAWRVLKPGGRFVLFSPNRYHPIETHGVIDRRSGSHLSPFRTPFLPWVPLILGRRRYRYWSRNYWPRTLVRMVREAGFAVAWRGYVWQTFENARGGKRMLIHRIAALPRLVSRVAEHVPFVRRFGVSQVIVARKPG